MNKFARESYELGVRYIGGCCGFQAYHIRAVAEELAEERGVLPRGSEKHIPWAGGLRMHTKPWVRARASRYTFPKLNRYYSIKLLSCRKDCQAKTKKRLQK